MQDTGCPVCGYPQFAETYPDGSTTYDLCPSCSFEAGVDGLGRDREERNQEFRRRWIEGGALWWSSARTPPPGWSGAEQLRVAGLIDEAGDGGDDDEDE